MDPFNSLEPVISVPVGLKRNSSKKENEQERQDLATGNNNGLYWLQTMSCVTQESIHP